MNEITPVERRELRARAHHLSPVVSIAANGLTSTVMAEIGRCLDHHELIKVRVYGHDRIAREGLLAEVCSVLGATPVQHIGNLLVIWRKRPEAAQPEAPVRPQTKARTAKPVPFAAAAGRRTLASDQRQRGRTALQQTRGKSQESARPPRRGGPR